MVQYDNNDGAGLIIVLMFYRSAYSQLKNQNTEPTESEFVEVSSDLKGHVIGKGGSIVNEIMEKSGAMIRKNDEGFTVSGYADQRAFAKRLILEKVVS